MDCLLSCLHALSTQIFDMEGLQNSCLLLRASPICHNPFENQMTSKLPVGGTPVFTLVRTDTSLDDCVLLTLVAISIHGFNCLRFIFFAFFRMGDLSFPHVVHKHIRSNGLNVLSDSNAIPNLILMSRLGSMDLAL